jgi:hypothetical protein
MSGWLSRDRSQNRALKDLSEKLRKSVLKYNSLPEQTSRNARAKVLQKCIERRDRNREKLISVVTWWRERYLEEDNVDVDRETAANWRDMWLRAAANRD